MQIPRRTLIGSIGSLALAARPTRAQAASSLRIGLLTDMSGPYRDVSGPSSVAAAAQAIEDFQKLRPDIKVTLVSADHTNKPDVAASILRQWFDVDAVDMVTDVISTPVAIVCNTVAEEKNKVQVNTSAGSSDLTGKYCGPNFVHWTYDTWCLAHASATALVRGGGGTWFFVTANYAFGKSAQDDATGFIQAAGGRVVGAAQYPFPETTDFASYLLQAQSSGARVIAFANAGADLVNCVKQAQEFGLAKGGTKLVGLVGFITDVRAMGLEVAQGLTMVETFYWDFDARTRSFMERLRPKLPLNVYPNMNHAGTYSGTLHYLKAAAAIGVPQARASGRDTVEAMKRLPTDDDCFGPGMIRADGRKIHPAYLFQVKAPSDSRNAGDVYKLLDTIPADQAFRPLDAGVCPMVKG